MRDDGAWNVKGLIDCLLMVDDRNWTMFATAKTAVSNREHQARVIRRRRECSGCAAVVDPRFDREVSETLGLQLSQYVFGFGGA